MTVSTPLFKINKSKTVLKAKILDFLCIFMIFSILGWIFWGVQPKHQRYIFWQNLPNSLKEFSNDASWSKKYANILWASFKKMCSCRWRSSTPRSLSAHAWQCHSSSHRHHYHSARDKIFNYTLPGVPIS